MQAAGRIGQAARAVSSEPKRLVDFDQWAEAGRECLALFDRQRDGRKSDGLGSIGLALETRNAYLASELEGVGDPAQLSCYQRRVRRVHTGSLQGLAGSLDS